MEKIFVLNNAYESCLQLAHYLGDFASETPLGKKKNIAVSGGLTPKLLFSIMIKVFRHIPWNNLNIFWTDERIVPIESLDSNYGEFYRLNSIDEPLIFNTYPYFTPQSIDYFSKLEEQKINETIKEIEDKIRLNVPFKNNFPAFDLILLGLGEDGHTASIFKDNLASFSSDKIVEKTYNPNTGQERLTLSGSVINNAEQIIFLCTGASKKDVVKQIIVDKDMSLPAAHIKTDKQLWYLDKESAGKLNL